CFGTNATGPAPSSTQAVTLTHLLQLNGTDGSLVGNAIPLSAPILLRGAYGNYGFFSGYGRVVVWAGSRVYHVSLPSGAVADLGVVPIPTHLSSFIWGYWGIAESTQTGLALVYARTTTTISRTTVPTGTTTTLATF